MTSPLTQAVFEHDNDACLIAARMGQQALPELTTLLENENSTIRERSILAMAGLSLTISYKLLFKAVEDANLQVAQTAVNEIAKRHTELSTELLIGLLEKLHHSSLKNPVVLLLGTRLPPEQSQHLEKYCNTENEQWFVLHCMAALAKMGIEQRRQQFSLYLRSLHDKPETLLPVFELVEYIQQPWLAPSLRLLLSNVQTLKVLNATLPGYPGNLRVCDKAARLINQLLSLNLPFIKGHYVHYSSAELAQVNAAASQYNY